MQIMLKNPHGVLKKAKLGFSWTTFFFTFLPALFRGDIKWAIIMIIGEVIVGFLTFGMGNIILNLIFAFIYNKIYIKGLISKGYLPFSEETRELLSIKGYIN